MDSIEAYQKRKAAKHKMDVDDLFVLADAIASRISYVFDNDKGKGDYYNAVVQPWQYYPDLYKDDRQAADEAVEKAKLEEIRQSRKDFAARWNKRFRGE